MRLDIFAVLSGLTGLFLLIGAGYGAAKLRVVSADASGTLSALDRGKPLFHGNAQARIKPCRDWFAF